MVWLPPDIVPPPYQPQEMPSGKLSRKEMRLLRYGNLCSDFAKIAVGAAASEKTKEVAEKHMRALEKELALMKKASAEASKKKKTTADAGTTSGSAGAMHTDGGSGSSIPVCEGSGVSSNSRAQNPPFETARGRPGQKRKKGALHLQPTRATTCSVCHESDHDARNCPVRLANPERYPLLSLFQ